MKRLIPFFVPPLKSLAIIRGDLKGIKKFLWILWICVWSLFVIAFVMSNKAMKEEAKERGITVEELREETATKRKAAELNLSIEEYNSYLILEREKEQRLAAEKRQLELEKKRLETAKQFEILSKLTSVNSTPEIASFMSQYNTYFRMKEYPSQFKDAFETSEEYRKRTRKAKPSIPSVKFKQVIKLCPSDYDADNERFEIPNIYYGRISGHEINAQNIKVHVPKLIAKDQFSSCRNVEAIGNASTVKEYDSITNKRKFTLLIRFSKVFLGEDLYNAS